MPTKIEWTDETWNPVTGCTKVSQGCKNCYAETIANRFWGERKFTDVMCHTERLDQPLSWKKPRRVFVNSMSDLFHEDVPDKFIGQVWSKMLGFPQHTFQILTKRSERMCDVVTRLVEEGERKGLRKPDNVWLGVSAENQKAANERVLYLLRTPAAVRFISYEPALGPLSLFDVDGEIAGGMSDDSLLFPADAIDWVIAGCESGPKARPAELDWFRSLRDQCQAAGVPFFLKQMMVDGKLVKMPELDGKVWAEFPG